MPQGNVAFDQEYCIIDDKFRQTVSEAPGFQWVDEAKPHHLTRKWVRHSCCCTKRQALRS